MQNQYIKNRKKFLLLFWVLLLGLFFSFHFLNFTPLRVFHTACIIKKTTGYSCPACGLTRMFSEMISFHFKNAFLYNPYFFILIVLILLYLLLFTIETYTQIHICPKIKLYWLIIAVAALPLFCIIRNTDWYLRFFYI